MGIRFACHVCGKHLNIKRDLAGRRGVCPACASKFRIPLEDAETSLPVDVKPMPINASGQGNGGEADHDGNSEPRVEEQVVPSSDEMSPALSDHAAVSAGQNPIEQPIADPDGMQPVGMQPVVTDQNATDHAAAEQVDPERIAAAQVGTAQAAVEQAVVEQAVVEQAGVAPVISDLGSTRIGVLEDDPEATWYVRPPSGGQYGPASSEILKQWIGEGRVAATALLWRDGWPQWRDASEALHELADQLPAGQVVSSVVSARGGVATSQSGAPSFSGQAGVGTDRRNRSMKRVLWIGVLSAVAVTLIGILVVVANLQVLEPPANP